jgi:hypothetical protein
MAQTLMEIEAAYRFERASAVLAKAQAEHLSYPTPESALAVQRAADSLTKATKEMSTVGTLQRRYG